MGPIKSDPNKHLITLTVIPLSGADCMCVDQCFLGNFDFYEWHLILLEKADN
jgi:hypothetical protein